MTQFRPAGFQVLPVIVKNLLIINGLFFLATFVIKSSFEYDLSTFLGLHYFGSQYFRPHQIITHLFMHANLMHIFFNMFALWMFGSALENIWGPKRFLIYYLVTGLGAAVIHSLVIYIDISGIENAINAFQNSPSPVLFREIIHDHFPIANKIVIEQFINDWTGSGNSIQYQSEALSILNSLLTHVKDIPTVGASGAVFGVLLAFGMIFPNTYLYIYFLFPIKAKYFVILYGLLELFSGLQNNPNDNVAHFAHLGGMLFGFVLIKYWNKSRKNFF